MDDWRIINSRLGGLALLSGSGSAHIIQIAY
jgi:hypothetical protein